MFCTKIASFKSRYEFKGAGGVRFYRFPIRTDGRPEWTSPTISILYRTLSCVSVSRFARCARVVCRSTRTRQTTRARAVVNFEKPRESVWLSRRPVLLRQPIARTRRRPAIRSLSPVKRHVARLPGAPGHSCGEGPSRCRHVSDFCFYTTRDAPFFAPGVIERRVRVRVWKRVSFRSGMTQT